MNYSLLSDEELVNLVKENDSEAFSCLTARYIEKAKIIALSFKNVPIENDDLIQEAMTGFLSAVYSFKNDSGCSFATYSSRCIKNRLLSVIRSSSAKKRIPHELVVPFEETTELSENVPSPEEHLISQSEAEYISSVISSSLSKQEKEIFMLYLTGMSYDEIARSARISQKAVDGTLQRARKKLREKLSL
ncbi:MAG: sigma-70 family RNA polymerase sigma factor [Clostridia bacterium]|nr:sigma-70 family RNA polymerase sigma factor [Clostridia bacterium]